MVGVSTGEERKVVGSESGFECVERKEYISSEDVHVCQVLNNLFLFVNVKLK